MSLSPAMFQYIKKLVGANNERRVAFAPLATPFTNDDFAFLNTEVYEKDPAKYYAEALEFSQKANSIIKKATIWEVGSQDFLYDRYEDILKNARLIQNRSLTNDEMLNRTNAKQILYDSNNAETVAYKDFKKFKQLYDDAFQKLAAHKNSPAPQTQNEITEWNNTLSQLQQVLADADLQWNALGNKIEISNALKAFEEPRDNKDRNDFAANWNEAKNLMSIKVSSIGGSDIYPVDCIPNNLYKYKGIEWNKITLNADDIKALEQQLKQDMPGTDISIMFGDAPVDLEKVSFEICRVILSRSWFNENILLSNYWDYPGIKISSADEDELFDGLLPTYPLEFILVKNVVPVLVQNSAVNEQLKINLKNGSPVFMGPFLLKNIDPAQNKPLAVQTFTANQLNVISKTNVQPHAVTSFQPLRFSALQALQKMKVFQSPQPQIKMVVPQVTVRDHRTGIDVTQPQQRAGLVFVDGHWERQRATPPPPLTFSLSGKINDENNHNVSEADITLLNTSTTTTQNTLSDINGSFKIENIANGNYHLTIKKDGFSTIEKEMSVASNTDLGTMAISSLNPLESFLLLAVVYKKLPLLPNPIAGEVYQ